MAFAIKKQQKFKDQKYIMSPQKQYSSYSNVQSPHPDHAGQNKVVKSPKMAVDNIKIGSAPTVSEANKNSGNLELQLI